MRSGIFLVKILESIGVVHHRRTRGQDREPVDISEIEGTRCRNISAAETPKSREAIRTVHHRRTRGGNRSIREKSRKESHPSGNRESRGQEVHTLRNCEVRNPDKVKSVHCRASCHYIGISGFGGSRILRTSTFRHWKVRKPDRR
jgi:hypothetical protein